MDRMTYTQRLQEALKENKREETTSLLENYSQQFREETAAVLAEAFLNGQVDFNFVKNTNIIGNFKQELTKTAVEQKRWNFLAKVYRIPEWSDVVFGHVSTCSVSDIVSFVKDMCPLAYTAKLCCQLAQERQYLALGEVLHIMDDHKIFTDGCLYPFSYKPFKQLVGRKTGLSRSGLLDLFRFFSADERRASQYMAVMIGSRLKKWKFIQTVFQTDRGIHSQGTCDVLCRALACRAWACAATILHKVLLNTNFERGTFVSMKYEVQQKILLSSVYGSSTFKPFLRKCLRLQYYGAGALLAIWAEKWGVVRQMLKRVHYGCFDTSNVNIISEILREENCRLVCDWVQRQPCQIIADSQYVDCVLWQCSVGRFTEMIALVNWFMGRCDNQWILEDMLYLIIVNAQADLLTKFFSVGLLHRVRIGKAVHELLRCWRTFEMTSAEAENPSESSEYKMLLTCFEGGCSTCICKQPETLIEHPALAAIESGVMRVVHIFYYTGVMSNSIIFRLHERVQSLDNMHLYMPADREAKVKEFLWQVVSNPRRLSNLCCIRVSELIGCGTDRKQRALALSLPMTLTCKVLFLDVLYPHEVELCGTSHGEIIVA